MTLKLFEFSNVHDLRQIMEPADGQRTQLIFTSMASYLHTQFGFRHFFVVQVTDLLGHVPGFLFADLRTFR